MDMALTHPEHGYYTSPVDDFEEDMLEDASRIGKRGDFITAPEISQLFGECLLIFFLTQHQRLGEKKFRFVELGPGKGTLIADILYASITSFPGFTNCIDGVHLVEVSHEMRRAQLTALKHLKKKLEGYRLVFPDEDEHEESEEHRDIPVHWNDSLSDVPSVTDTAQFVICQELLDALPVHSFQKTEEGWRERLVDVDSLDESPYDSYCNHNSFDSGLSLVAL